MVALLSHQHKRNSEVWEAGGGRDLSLCTGAADGRTASREAEDSSVIDHVHNSCR